MGILRAFSATNKAKRLLAVSLHPSARLKDIRNTQWKANTWKTQNLRQRDEMNFGVLGKRRKLTCIRYCETYVMNK
jgi:hypothetical protein